MYKLKKKSTNLFLSYQFIQLFIKLCIFANKLFREQYVGDTKKNKIWSLVYIFEV